MTESAIIWQETDQGEDRAVVLCEVPGGFSVEERTQGPATKVVYGEDAHAHSIEVRGDMHVVAFLDALGIERDALTFEQLSEALVAFFDGGRRALIDLEDALDRACVPYAYRAAAGEDVVMRPPLD